MDARPWKLAKLLILMPLLAPPSVGVCSHCLAAFSLARTVDAHEASSAEDGCPHCRAEKKQDCAKPSPAPGSCCVKNPSDSPGIAHWARSLETARDFWTGLSIQAEAWAPDQELAAIAVLHEYRPPADAPPILQLISPLRI